MPKAVLRRLTCWMAAALVAAAALVLTTGVVGPGRSEAVAATESYNIWPSSARPDSAPDIDQSAVEIGVQFRSSRDGYIKAIRYFRFAANDGPHTATLWTSDGEALAEARFEDETDAGWQEASLAQPVRIRDGQTYIASYQAPHGRYAADQNALSPSEPRVTRDLTAIRGVYSYGNGVPASTWRDSNYFVDVAFTPSSLTTPSPTTPDESTPSSSSTTGTATTSTTRPPSGSSTTTTSPSSELGCAGRPSACGFPDGTNTGVEPGVSLARSGCVTARTPGQVIEGLQIDGCTISVEAPNVTIRNVKITHTAVQTWGIIIRSGASATIENVEVAGRDKSMGSVQYAILSQTSSRVTVNRADLHHCADCIQGEGMTVTNSYIHDMANPPGAHVDGFQCNAQCGVTLRHNTIFNEWGQTAAIALFADFGTPRNSVIDGNLLAGGGYTVYGGDTNATGIQITNNRFARIFHPKSGQYGHVAHFDRSGSGNIWSGNSWDDTGASISP